MGNFSDHIVNQRFKDVFSALENQNLIKGKSDIAKHLGTYNHVINSILKGQRNITVDQLSKLFDIYQIDANYMFGLSDEMFSPGANLDGSFPTRSLQEKTKIPLNNITLYPLRALAGDAIESQEAFEKEFPKFSVPGLSGDLSAIEISGDSMYPTLTNGDIVVCEPLDRGVNLRDNHVYVIVTDVVVAKRIQLLRNVDGSEQLRLISDNSSVYQPYEINLEEVRQILKVKARLTDHAIG